MDKLHDLVSHKLGQDLALHKLTEEAEAGQAQPEAGNPPPPGPHQG